MVESNQKALVFSHLPNATLAKIEPMLKAFHPMIFDGSLTDKRREAIIDDFEKQLHPSVLLMSVQSGGVGLTLTRANHVFHFDHWWNPAIARQAEGRAYRMGQKQTVFVHDLYTVNTIEQRIHELLQEKQALFNNVIDDLSAEYIQRSIDDAALFGLFGLTPPTDMTHFYNDDIASKKDYNFQVNSSSPHETTTTPFKPQEQKSKNSLNDLSPVDFERFIAQLYRNMGYQAKVTKQSRDHGIDVYAKRLTHLGTEIVIIQCKHYPTRTVGEAEVRNLLGAWQEFREAQYAVLVTSGTFSNDAIAFAQKHQIKLIDRPELLQLWRQHNK